MLHLLWLLGYVLLGCFLWAKLEIHIEGADGWAGKAPTWRYQGRWWMKLSAGKPLTGYHFYLNLLFLWFLHFIFVITWHWTWSLEFVIWGVFFLMGVVEDFLWFWFNPHWGLKRFRREEIWWCRQQLWFGRVPSSYIVGLVVAAALFWLGWPALR